MMTPTEPQSQVQSQLNTILSSLLPQTPNNTPMAAHTNEPFLYPTNTNTKMISEGKEEQAMIEIESEFFDSSEGESSTSPQIQSIASPKQYSHSDLLILIDWDDTLFPTTIINEILVSRDGNDLALVPDEYIQLLHKLGNVTYVLLRELIDKYGSESLHIVTNSLQGWIAESLSYASCINPIYKSIESLLISNNITMLSAQTMYKSKCEPNSTPTLWKQLCFGDIFARIHGQTKNGQQSRYSHVLSIGDQWTDHCSVKQCIEAMDSAKHSYVHHVIKLKMNPDLNDMINEVMYIQTCFYQIFDVISHKKSPFFVTPPQSIQPVIIDYFEEEVKYYRSQMPESKKSNNCININVNVNVNVNVVNE